MFGRGHAGRRLHGGHISLPLGLLLGLQLQKIFLALPVLLVLFLVPCVALSLMLGKALMRRWRLGLGLGLGLGCRCSSGAGLGHGCGGQQARKTDHSGQAQYRRAVHDPSFQSRDKRE